EKQGIDKIATHRLTWEEYQAEKEAQIQAEINGEEYVPVTHMGEVNHQIRKANELQSSINQKIVSLEEYKETIKRDMKERYIPEIKQSISLSDEQRNALKFVAKRINKYVT